MQTPSKKIIFLLIACVFSVSLIFFTSQKIKKDSIIAVEVATSTDENSADAVDTDNDGLADWEEILRGTDPKNPDTDGDSTKDGEEVRLNRDPLKVGPNDSLTATTSTSTKLIPEPNTLTNTFAKDLFGKFLNAQDTGTLDDQAKQDLVQSMVDQYSESTIIDNHYTAKDIVTSSSLDLDKVKQYANAMITLEDAGVRTTKAIAQNSEETKNLNTVGESFKKLSKDLGNIIVPDAVVRPHIAIMNSYYALGETLKQISASTNDPIKMIYYIQQVGTYQTNKETLYLQIASFIKNSGVTFNNDEPGSYWLKMLQ